MQMPFNETPFNRALHFEKNTGDGVTEVTMPIQEWFTQEFGVVHGGMIASLADTAAVYALLGSLKASEQMTSIEFKINFLRPARIDGGSIAARATVVDRG